MHDARPTASGTDDPLGPVTLIGAVTIRVAGCIGQDGLEFGGAVLVRRRDLDAPDQPGPLVGRDMRLVTMHRLAAPMPILCGHSSSGAGVRPWRWTE